MASRLTELLDRIRPAGTPGAPSDPVPRHEQAVAAELAGLATVLAGFDAEVDDILADARAEAERLRVEAERRAQQLRGDLPDRIAVAEATALDSTPEHDDPDGERFERECDEQVRRIRARASALAPELVERAIAVIWDDVASGSGDRGGAS